MRIVIYVLLSCIISTAIYADHVIVGKAKVEKQEARQKRQEAKQDKQELRQEKRGAKPDGQRPDGPRPDGQSHKPSQEQVGQALGAERQDSSGSPNYESKEN